jgi:hypothetical protein
MTLPSLRLLRFSGTVRVPQEALSAASFWASGAGQGPALKVAVVLLLDELPEELPPQAAHPNATTNVSVTIPHLNPLKAFIPPNFV